MKIFYRLFFILLIVFLGLAVYYFYGKRVEKPEEEASPWQTNTFDRYRFSIDSPLPLKPNKKIFVDTSKFSKKLALYGDSPETGFYLLVESQEYREAIPPDHLDQFQRKVEGLLRSNDTYQKLQLGASPVTCSDLPGLEVAGTYLSQETPYRFEAIEVSQGNWSWNLELVYQDLPVLADEAHRVIQSLKVQ